MTGTPPAAPRRPMTPHGGSCSDCKRRNRLVFPITKQGGGSYRRAQRSYSSHICGECAMQALPYVYNKTHAMATQSGYAVSDLIDIAENLVATDGDCDLEVRIDDFTGQRTWERTTETRTASGLIASYRTVVAERVAASKARRSQP